MRVQGVRGRDPEYPGPRAPAWQADCPPGSTKAEGEPGRHAGLV